MNDREARECAWVHNTINSKPPEYPDASKEEIMVMGHKFQIRWIRYYAYCRHNVSCLYMSANFASLRTQVIPPVYGQFCGGVVPYDLDLALLMENARLLIAEKREKAGVV